MAEETNKQAEEASRERDEAAKPEDAKELVDEAQTEETPETPECDGEEEAPADDEAKEDGQTSEKGSKSFIKDQKKKKKDKKDEKIEELNDRLLRSMAEFENFRNRSEKEKAAMFEVGAKSVIEKILPVVDNLERGLDAVTEEEKESAFVKGIEAVYKQFGTALEEIGVVPIEAVGKEFDPNLHNAVMHDEDESMEANIVSEEFQKGYLYKDSVVRHSMVKVVN